jgi:tetratricopeptide (TPR) repeat protein
MIHRMIALFTMLLLTLPVTAQEEGATFYVYAEINASPYSDMTEFGVGEAHTTPQFFKRLGEALIVEGFNPVFLTEDTQLGSGSYPVFFEETSNYPLYYEENALWVDVRVTHEIDWIYLSPYAAVERPPLPAGTSGWSAVPEVDNTNLALAVDVAMAMALYVADACEAAMPYFDRVSTDPMFTEEVLFIRLNMLFYRANCEYTLGNKDEAEVLYKEILDVEIDNTTFDDPRLVTDYAVINLAWIYATTDRSREARKLLDAYQDVEYTMYTSREMPRFLDRAGVYMEIGEEDRAIDEITRLIDLATGEVETEASVTFLQVEIAQLYTERGRLYAQSGAQDNAMRDYEQAITADETYPKVYYLRGKLFIEMEDNQAARRDFEEFLVLEEGFYNYYEEDLAPFVEEVEAYLEN